MLGSCSSTSVLTHLQTRDEQITQCEMSRAKIRIAIHQSNVMSHGNFQTVHSSSACFASVWLLLPLFALIVSLSPASSFKSVNLPLGPSASDVVRLSLGLEQSAFRHRLAATALEKGCFCVSLRARAPIWSHRSERFF